LRFSKKLNFFKFFLKNKAGRVFNNNKITVLSKGRLKKLRSTSVVINLNVRCFYTFISLFTCKNKIFTVCKQTSGTLFILPYVYGVRIGHISTISNLPERFFGIWLPGSLIFLKFINGSRIFSNLSIFNLPKFAVSNGTYCQILEKFLDYNIICVLLPSGKNKFVSG